MYEPIYKANQLILGTNSDVAIICGWFELKSIEKMLDKSQYAVIGNLYIAELGINFLIINLFANPQITKLLLVGVTKEDQVCPSVSILEDFFINGTEYPGCIFDSSQIQTIRDSIVTHRVSNDKPLSAEVLTENLAILQQKTSKALRPKVILEMPISKECLTSGSIYSSRISAKTVGECWIRLLQRIRTSGIFRSTGYDGKLQEILNLSVVIEEFSDNPYPSPNFLTVNESLMEDYLPKLMNDQAYMPGVKYTYGQRLRSWFDRDQLEDVINKLVAERDTSSAVMSLWDPGSGKNARFNREPYKGDHNYSNSPCLNHIWLKIVDDKLTMTATFRSNDMYMAWPSNAIALHFLLEYITKQVNALTSWNLKVGSLTTVSESAHIYDQSYAQVDELIDTHFWTYVRNKANTFKDPIGYFLIELQDKKIVANLHDNTTHQLVRSFQGKNIRWLIEEICQSTAIEASHAAYLALEFKRLQESPEGYRQA